ncbi:GNAT family N-acetyltransferase [Aquibacillus saliphilus]|uniref:GNAT family N-acetyltransferase n=1 Tax=Aquibacillus saliphilus TaxID=1909422 RepID=UPI001CEFB472|nr:GNAT family N-acetyltransferase [Aquibacillus saliphilus]
MNLTIKNMDENSVRKILSWRYEKPYDFYNSEVTEDEIKERLDGSYKNIADDNGDVFGFLCTGETAQIPVGYKYGVYNDKNVDIGLGMDPDYVGKGYGYNFCTFIISYIRENYAEIPIRLSVATFNKRAIHLYEKLGFEKKDKFTTDFTEFITMIKEN